MWANAKYCIWGNFNGTYESPLKTLRFFRGTVPRKKRAQQPKAVTENGATSSTWTRNGYEPHRSYKMLRLRANTTSQRVQPLSPDLILSLGPLDSHVPSSRLFITGTEAEIHFSCSWTFSLHASLELRSVRAHRHRVLHRGLVFFFRRESLLRKWHSGFPCSLEGGFCQKWRFSCKFTCTLARKPEFHPHSFDEFELLRRLFFPDVFVNFSSTLSRKSGPESPESTLFGGSIPRVTLGWASCSLRIVTCIATLTLKIALTWGALHARGCSQQVDAGAWRTDNSHACHTESSLHDIGFYSPRNRLCFVKAKRMQKLSCDLVFVIVCGDWSKKKKFLIEFLFFFDDTWHGCSW